MLRFRNLLAVLVAPSVLFFGCQDLDDDPNSEPLKYGELQATGQPAQVPQFGVTGVRQVITVATRSDGLSHPRDLEFDPDAPDNLWVVDRDWDGNIIIFDAGSRGQRIDRMRDMAASHFMEEVSSLAFSDIGTFGTCQESRNSMDGYSYPNDFMGPVLWSSDLSIHCKVNQVQGPEGLNGSHLDMLHQSPLCMGMAHEDGNAFYVADGLNGHIVRYDFQRPHVPGGHDHSDGRVSRYPELTFSRIADIPSHMLLEGNVLYYIDSGDGSLKVADLSTGTPGRTLTAYNEPLELFNEIVGVAQGDLVTGLDTPSGLAMTEEHIFVSLPATGDIAAFDRMGVEIARIATGKPGVMGLTIGPDGRLWYVNAYEGTVNMIDALGEYTAPEVDLTRPVAGDCQYPAWNTDIGLGKVLPPLAWSVAIDGNTPLDSFSALDIYCNPEWSNVETVFFVVVPEWIPWLWEYVAYVDSLSAQIEAAGGRVVFVGAQNQVGGLIGLNDTQRMLAEATPRQAVYG